MGHILRWRERLQEGDDRGFSDRVNSLLRHSFFPDKVEDHVDEEVCRRGESRSSVQPDGAFAEYAAAGATTPQCRRWRGHPATDEEPIPPNSGERAASTASGETNAKPTSFRAVDGLLCGGESCTDTRGGATNSKP